MLYRLKALVSLCFFVLLFLTFLLLGRAIAEEQRPIRIYFVEGKSMEPTYTNGMQLKVSSKVKVSRFDTVIFKLPKSEVSDDYYLKRVIGLPGERIRYINGVLYVNNRKTADPFAAITKDFDYSMAEIPSDHYLVLGDNRENSKDSRVFGYISLNSIKGIVAENKKEKSR